MAVIPHQSVTAMSFDEVYDVHFEYVYRSLRRLGVSDGDASDAAQDVFMVVHKKLPDFEARSKMTTWIFRICMHIASDWRRSARVRHEATDVSPADIPEPRDTRPTADAQLAQREELRLAESMLEELTDEQRQVFVLFEMEEMDGDEIALSLEIPVGTVRSRLRLAREAFARAMSRHKSAESFREQGQKGKSP